MAIDTTGYVADWLQASYQIRTNRTELPERPFSEPSRVDRIRDTLEQAGAQADPAQLQPGIGQRLDIFI